jgi:hypothetical protein
MSRDDSRCAKPLKGFGFRMVIAGHARTLGRADAGGENDEAAEMITEDSFSIRARLKILED